MKNIKRIVAMLLCVFMLVSTGCNTAPAKKLSISDSAVALSLFEEKTITVETNITGDIVWTNSDDSVVVLTSDGASATLLAIKAGSSTVTATVGEKSVTCAVTVAQSEDALVLDVTSAKSIVLDKDATAQIASTVSFKDAAFTKASVSYSVDVEGVVTVSNSGLITAVGSGSATVKVVASYYGNASNEVSIAVTVLPDVEVSVNVAEVKLALGSDKHPTEVAVIANQTVDGGEPAAVEVSEFDVTDANVATFEDGKIKALAVGSTVITLTFTYNEHISINKEITVTVGNAPQVVIEASDISGLSNRSLKGDCDLEYLGGQYAEIRPTLTINGEAVAYPVLSFELVTDSDIVMLDTGVTYFTAIYGYESGKINVGYTDEYGIKHIKEVNVSVETPLWYGTNEKYYGVDENGENVYYEGVFAKNPTTHTAFRIDNVELPTEDSENKQIIRMQCVPQVDNGPQAMYITIMDSDDHGNYVSFMAKALSWDKTASYVGVRASTWGSYSYGGASSTDVGVVFSNGSFATMGLSGGDTIAAYQFSLFGSHIAGKNVSAKESAMMGISVDGTIVYMHHEGKVTKLMDLYEEAELAGKEAWEGFNCETVDIQITFTSGVATGASCVYIDTLGGKPVTDISDDMYYVRNWASINGYDWTPKA